MDSETELYRLLSAYKEGTIDPSERLKLELWADEDDMNRALFELLSGESPDTGRFKRLFSYDKDRVWCNVRHEATRNRRRRLFRASVRTAAAAVLLVGTVWLAEQAYDTYRHRDALISVIQPGQTKALLELSSGRTVALTDNSDHCLMEEADHTEILVEGETATFRPTVHDGEKRIHTAVNRLSVPRGGEYRLKLSDGSQVWLNAESEISFPSVFSDSIREVHLRGEAYFEVAHDAAHPFVVRTDMLSVRVLGTSFNLATYADDPMVEATLIEGSLKVSSDRDETLLCPGMQACLDKQSNTLTTHEVYAESHAAWARRMFVFFNEPIPSICRKLSRWYDVEIDASDPALRDVLYSGMIERAETLNEIVELFSATGELIFRERKGRVIVEKTDMLGK